MSGCVPTCAVYIPVVAVRHTLLVLGRGSLELCKMADTYLMFMQLMVLEILEIQLLFSGQLVRKQYCIIYLYHGVTIHAIIKGLA